MRASVAWVVLAVAAPVGGGCKTVTKPGEPLAPDVGPPLLIGPEATAKAPPPVELPAKETALLCMRTAQHYEKDGRVEDAIKLYEKARTTDPATANQAGRRLAVLYDKFGDFTKSAAEYEAQIQLAPNDAELLTDFGYSHYCRGDWANAEATLRRAVQIDPKQKRAWVNLGLAQAQQSKWDESLQSFSNAVRPADAQSNIAFVMASQGRNAEAKERYRAALSLDPSHKVAQAGLRTLEKPPAKGESEPRKADEKFDAEAAAAKVPSIAEIEARIKGDSGHSPVVLPTPTPKTTEP